MSAIAQKAAKSVFAKQAAAYQPEDPYYEEVTDERGRKKKVKRVMPTGLSKRDEKALKKIRRRAHYLDKGMNLCGFRVGWTFFIGFIPVLGDVVDATLNYTLIVKPTKKLEVEDWLIQRMLINNALSAGMGFVPVVGDIALAVFKANSRNAHLLEEYLIIRGREFAAAERRGPSVVENHGTTAPHAEVAQQFGPGKGMVEQPPKKKGFFGK
ncbi:hypothetical protein P7C73_g842, partial [Tremellales sp. Uapishka_1]